LTAALFSISAIAQDMAIDMDIFEGWNVALRIYEPTGAYFNDDWVLPELEIVE